MTEAFDMRLSDLQAWRRLVRRARACAADPATSAGDLKEAVKATARAVCPSAEARSAITMPLRRLAGEWPAMNRATRAANADKLLWLAGALAPLVGMEDEAAPGHRALKAIRPPALRAQDRLRLQAPLEPMADDPRPERAPRADLEG